MKGTIQNDHMPLNKFQLLVAGLPPLTLVTMSGIEDELQTVDMPDRTVASGGNRGMVEFTGAIPAHHLIEQSAMEIWFAECQDPVSPTYKKIGTLIMQSITGTVLRSFSMDGLFLSKRALPEFDMNNEGEMAVIEWTFRADNVLPL